MHSPTLGAGVLCTYIYHRDDLARPLLGLHTNARGTAAPLKCGWQAPQRADPSRSSHLRLAHRCANMSGIVDLRI